MVKLSFARSGGLVAAPGLQIRASATLEVSGGVVVADPDYRRLVDPQESAEVMSAAEALADALRQAHGAVDDAPRAQTAARDAFQFQFTIETASGTRADFVSSEADAMNRPADCRRLVQWASREADAIVRHRFGPAT